MPSTHLVSFLVAASLLSGCAAGPDYVRPDVAMPQRFQAQAAVDQRHASGSADLVSWWAGFGDPQLTRFVTLALDQNLDLAEKYDVPLKKGVPAAAILKGDGTLVVSQKNQEFEKARSMTTEAVLAFLERWKPGRS